MDAQGAQQELVASVLDCDDASAPAILDDDDLRELSDR